MTLFSGRLFRTTTLALACALAWPALAGTIENSDKLVDKSSKILPGKSTRQPPAANGDGPVGSKNEPLANAQAVYQIVLGEFALQRNRPELAAAIYGDLAQRSKKDAGGKDQFLAIAYAQVILVDTEPGALPDCWRGKLDCIRTGIGEEIVDEGWPSRWQQPQASDDATLVLVGVNDVNGRLTVVAVALHSVDDIDIPAEPIMEDSGAQPKHLFEQRGILAGIVLLDDDDHVHNPIAIG